MSETRLVHHELCFGCGRTNLFGLLMEVEQAGEGRVRARGFIKQDHQGPQPGVAHEGVIAAALSEAMSFACGDHMHATSIEVRLYGSVPVGTFVDVEAEGRAGDADEASATARVDEQVVGRARGTYEARV